MWQVDHFPEENKAGKRQNIFRKSRIGRSGAKTWRLGAEEEQLEEKREKRGHGRRVQGETLRPCLHATLALSNPVLFSSFFQLLMPGEST
jgi:hypothetical protein